MSYELSYNTHDKFFSIHLLQEEATMTHNNVMLNVGETFISASIRLRESFEECAIQLHHHTPQDELDKGMFCLFANKR
ncbi:hypothetical protein Glove_13g127 [Diversispora epigaea]|uniref:Uncharacterized protein n=1 Tax=Diversispora epigaea TaxID=1348612 RepID=A0A397JMK5_9GLOM|nr:hypothetical protein Glove_13g127 [Diversispora epigaea]